MVERHATSGAVGPTSGRLGVVRVLTQRCVKPRHAPALGRPLHSLNSRRSRSEVLSSDALRWCLILTLPFFFTSWLVVDVFFLRPAWAVSGATRNPRDKQAHSSDAPTERRHEKTVESWSMGGGI